MPNTNTDLQRKAGFFHSLGKVITEQNNSAGVINIGQGIGFEVREVLDMIRKIVDKHDQIKIKQNMW